MFKKSSKLREKTTHIGNFKSLNNSISINNSLIDSKQTILESKEITSLINSNNISLNLG